MNLDYARVKFISYIIYIYIYIFYEMKFSENVEHDI